MTNEFNVLRRLARNVTVPLAAVCLGARADFTNEFVVADGSFHEAANWSSNAVPDSTMRAHVSGDRTARISSDVTVNRFGVGVTGNGTVIQTGGNVRMTAVNNGGSNVNSAASFYLSGADRYDSTAAATSSRYALYHLSGGTVDAGYYYCHIGQHRDDRNSSEGALRITGGSFTTRNWTAIGRFTEHSHGHLLVEDEGTMTVTQNGLNVGESGSGMLTVKNGGELTVNAPITFAADGSVSVGRGYVLDGGRVTGAQFRGIDGKGKQKGLFVDGGILSPDCSAIANSRTNWITGLPALNVGSRGAIFDTAGRDASVPQVLTVADVPERLTTNNLVHRWSFNGDLTDSVGNQNATAVNEHFTDFSSYTLPGGTKGTGYIDLGSDVLPKDGSGVTLEIWATQLSAQRYSRVFEIGLDTTKTMSMAWSTETKINEDRIGITYKTGNDKGEFYDVGESCSLPTSTRRRPAGRSPPRPRTTAGSGTPCTTTTTPPRPLTRCACGSRRSPRRSWPRACGSAPTRRSARPVRSSREALDVWIYWPPPMRSPWWWRTACSPPARAAQRRSYTAGRSTTAI